MSSPLLGPAGNTYNKYVTENPAERILMQNFRGCLMDLFSRTGAQEILSVGCGEGYDLRMLQDTFDLKTVMGIDVDMAVLEEAAQRVTNAGIAFADGHALPFEDESFDIAIALEVLEHVGNPAQVLQEMHRVTRKHIIISVPNEPLWRVLNFCRGKYMQDFGNTPGHVNHWSTSGIVRLVDRYFNVVLVKQPFPWSMVFAEKNPG